ncbi:MAG: cytochrome c oxidase subunit 3 [Rhodospirillaceae bacterium]|nr:cytochrome c oxidase subunit 3 [Rhodospirillaceae bacterium]|tara:strand:- start:2659 stop:3489 length:831 start_codon:yes stop_codon:yes gene_type:complete
MVPPAESGASATDYDYHGHKHPYHLVDPSPWPFIGSISGLVMAVGAVLYMHEQIAWVLILGTLGVMGTMAGWFWEVIKEAEFRGYHNPVVQVGMRYGMALFIASEVMFFVCWFWAYFNAALFPSEQIEGTWPPPGVQTFDTWDLPFLNTLILLMSGITVTWAHHALREGDRRHFLQGLGLTIFLGVCFTGVQAFEYSHAAFGFSDGIYPSTFYMATGFHGFHVLVGTIFLIVCFMRGRAGHFKPDHHFGFEAAAWYWHFVDVVWLFLFICIYWWGR